MSVKSDAVWVPFLCIDLENNFSVRRFSASKLADTIESKKFSVLKRVCDGVVLRHPKLGICTLEGVSPTVKFNISVRDKRNFLHSAQDINIVEFQNPLDKNEFKKISL
jgi:hypothetical protein